MQIISLTTPNFHIQNLLTALEDSAGYSLDFNINDFDFFNSQIPSLYAMLSTDSAGNEQMISCILLYPSNDTLFEINGVTHPDFRNKGYFSKLLCFTFNTLKENGITSVLSSKKLMYPFLHCNIYSTECVMTYSHTSITPSLTKTDEIAEYIYDYGDYEEYNYVYITNKTPVGILKLRLYPDASFATLHHVLIRRKYRGNGYGKGLLTGALNMFFEINDTNIILHVSENNTAAINLYKNNGFSLKERLTYYIISTKNDFINS